MKKLFFFLIGASIVMGIYSCQKTFLQKPDTSGTVTLSTVYSSSNNALSALFQVYRTALIQGWPGGIGTNHNTLGAISGEQHRGESWHGTYLIANGGLTPNATSDFAECAAADNFSANFTNIRAAYLVAENIDKVPDMDATNKAYVKAEVAGMIAYRYVNMFIRYGGMPVITGSYLPTDNLSAPRATLQATMDFANKMADQAIAGLPDKWPNNVSGNDQTGRLTKGAVMAMKAKLAMFAARPLFNSATPYLSNGANNNLICFGNVDANRWTIAITANEAVLTWAASNGFSLINTGGAGVGNPNPNAFDDYGNATSTPNNQEVILAYKDDNNAQSDGGTTGKWYNMSLYMNVDRYDNDDAGMLSNFLTNYYKTDGTNQSWPQVGDAAPRPAADYLTRIAQMEPRFKADHIGPGYDAANNPGIAYWTGAGWSKSFVNRSSTFPNASSTGRGCAISTKFYYHAGSRVWFEYPLFRLAETYLNLAEAYNESGNTAKALQNLNIVHNRAGLPAITETNQTLLRGIIQREWAVEFYNESHRYYDVKHWKLADIPNGIIGGGMREFQFTTQGSGSEFFNTAPSLVNYWDAVVYTAYWSPKMYLEPIPQAEVNKQVIVQNPGY